MSSATLFSYGFGVATKNASQEIIEVFYPQPVIAPDADISAILCKHFNHADASCNTYELDDAGIADLSSALQGVDQSAAESLAALAGAEQCVVCLLGTDAAPASVSEVFLKLHLLSHRLTQPQTLALDGMFGILKNLAWTNVGPIDLDELPARQLEARLNGETLDVQCVDKFPKMTNYVVPRGVRIADTARVRLGAYVGEGTTVMHEGFVNFNAGTLGTAMIEGRISAGVIVGNNSDLGGGCSTMGTLSGGGKEIISVGENCLIGANAGIGFPLANGCIVEAGLYVTAGTKVNLLDGERNTVKTVKAKELMTLENHLYRRNSLNGAVECVPLKSQMSLNEELHSHN